MQGGVPIVPIVIRNAGELLWRGSSVIKTGTVDVIVHEPIDVQDWKREELGEQVERVRALFVETLAQWAAARGVVTGQA
jgi:putative phosphoserine phosphatase/1-acylglycerol-3-phosphate O-acyltransferase